ncbi:MAG TPA: Fe-S cluster assembly protein SufD [Candidatus Binatia bacterium]|nr:Fe-S cluster assembly protein SufD [Candidatus Binatia bacterium]
MASHKGKEGFLNAFDRRFAKPRGASWLHNLRRSAMERFDKSGLPTTRHEDWKYTNLEPIAALEFSLAKTDGFEVTRQDIRSLSFADGVKNRLVFVNGIYSDKHSSTGNLPAGTRVESLAEVLRQDADLLAPWLARYAEFEDRPFVSLNTALMEDGAVIFIPTGCRLEQPIEVIYLSTGAATPVVLHPRNLIVSGEGSEVKIVESYVGVGDGVYFVNPVTEIAGAAGSTIDYYRLQREAGAAFHIGSLWARLERASTLVTQQVTLGGALVRNDIYAMLNGEGADCTLDGLYLAEGEQHIDNHTEIDHAQPRASSRELYKGILRGRARGVFNGKIVVRKAAQKTDARQSNKNLLLSKDAVVNSKPQLEIYADDVKCSHGSTIGQLDRDALFYLRSRGIGEEDARSLLSYGFAAEVLGRMRIAGLRAGLEEYLLKRFGRTAADQ